MKSIAKQTIIDLILAELERQLSNADSAAKSAHEAATHPESSAESKWDTFGLESSYLAGAQASRAKELKDLLLFFRGLTMSDFEPKKKITAMAVVELDREGENEWYFLVPKGIGMKLKLEQQDFWVVTCQSPIGKAMLNHKVGDAFELKIGGAQKEFEVLSIG